ncbi:MAG: hypothetical protein KTR32_32365 [Granulosicoccus sp.]|nr:hypothetical protein [Granulosicoccus sp.]
MQIAQADNGIAVSHSGPVVKPSSKTLDGERRTIRGADYIRYGQYWVRYYPPLEESLASRKTLIDHLTRRAFHHTEPGINTPGERLDVARMHYKNQVDPTLKRVNAAMLAGALFNRATDIFTAIVELEEKGVCISFENELMKACGDYFKEALELGKDVRHFSGEEGIDELWGEPFRAFTLPIDAYYESRYIKVAQAMTNIDKLAARIGEVYGARSEFTNIEDLINTYAIAAKEECETMKSDPCIFEVWPKFVASGEAVGAVKAKLAPNCNTECKYVLEAAQKSLVAGRDLINWIARARVPMPKSTDVYFKKLDLLVIRLQNC